MKKITITGYMSDENYLLYGFDDIFKEYPDASDEEQNKLIIELIHEDIFSFINDLDNLKVWLADTAGTENPISISDVKTDAMKIYNEILKQLSTLDNETIEGKTQIIHDTLRQTLNFSKHKDKNHMCVWCMVDRLYEETYRGEDDKRQ